MTDPTPLAPPSVTPDAAAAAAARFTASARPDVAYDVIETPVGTVVAAATQRGLVRLAYDDFGGGLDRILDDLAARVSPRVLSVPHRLDPVRRELEQYFAGDRRRFDVPLDWRLTTPFQRKVLHATAAIPFGETRSYAEVSAAAGSPGGARATGNALGGNPIPVIVPCHRVLHSGGGLGGYTGGVERKRVLLGVEGAGVEPDHLPGF
jgi:methylated-DNA-[protein]-cysteine S-methyltransferase